MHQMNAEESFEPDYAEDTEDVLNEKLLLSGVEDATTEQNPIIMKSEVYAQYVSSCPPGLQQSVEAMDEEILEGDGFFCEENVEKTAKEHQLCAEEELRSDCEKSIKMAVASKQWSDLEAVFWRIESFPNLRESLSFFCADQLKAATEFLGILKQLKGGYKDSVALIGSKLIINAELCSNHAAGILILKMMVDEGVAFHDLTIRMFSTVDVVKSAVAICFQQKDYSLLCSLLEKSDFFGLRNVDAEDLRQRRRICDFKDILQKLFDVLDSSKDGKCQLASTCLAVLRIALDGKYVDGEFSQYSQKVWLLCEIFTSDKKAEELASVLNLSLKYDDLIAWNHSSRKAILTFLLSHANEVNKIYKAAKAFVDISHKIGSMPKFMEFSGDCKTLTLLSSMTEEELRLFLILFIKTAKDNHGGRSGTVKWKIQLKNNSITSVEYNEANKNIEISLRKHFKNLSYVKESQGYSVNQHVNSSKTSRPFVNGKKMKQSLQKSSVHLKTTSNHGKLGKKSKKPLPSSSSINPTPNVPDSIKKHPRFSGVFSQSSHLNTNPDLPSAVVSHPRFAKPQQLKNLGNKTSSTPTKALFSRSMNRLMVTPRTNAHLSSLRPDSLDAADVLQRLKAVIGQRLSQLVNGGHVSTSSARLAMSSLPDKLMSRLPTDSRGNVVYNAAQVQALVDIKVRSLLNEGR